MGLSKASRILEGKIVNHCSPVLAGIKPANMFSCHIKTATCCNSASCSSMSPMDFIVGFSLCAKALKACGVEVAVLAQRETSVLLYIYRPDLLDDAISETRTADYLCACGYAIEKPISSIVAQLASRVAAVDLLAGVSKSCAFPHEIGLFLGYPFDDVIGFIENSGRGYLAVGCWKVYSRQRDAEDAFCRIESCKQELKKRFEEGACIEDLASAHTKHAVYAAHR